VSTCQAASLPAAGSGTEEEAAGEHLARRDLDPQHRSVGDAHHAARINATLAGDADA
jgi:hypothetical protein